MKRLGNDLHGPFLGLPPAFGFSFLLPYFLLFSSLTILSSCGHQLTRKGRKVDLAKEQMSRESSIQLAQKKARNRLQKIVAQAEELGPQAKEFLASNLFLKASQASLATDYESSTLVYEYVLKLSPQDPYVILKYATDLVRLGKVTSALSMLEKHYPKSGIYQERYGMLLGGIYLSYEKAEMAAKIYREILRNNPNNVEACLFLAKVDFQRKKTEQVFRTLRKCEGDNPEQGVLSYHRGKIELSMGKMNEAKKSFQKSLKAEPTFYQSALALGMILEDQNDIAGATAAYQELLQHWPTNRVILSRLVQVLFASEKYEEVIGHAQALVFLSPNDLNLKVKLGVLYADRGDYPQAIQLLEEVIREVPESDKVLYYLGVIYQEVEEYERAVSMFVRIPKESALYFESSIQTAQILKGLAINNQENGPRFLGFVDERSRANSNSSSSSSSNSNSSLELELQMIKGQYYELSDRVEEGIEAIERMAARSDFTNSQRYYLAILHDRVKNYQRSIKLIQQILQNDSSNSHAWNFIGYSYLERGADMDKAYEYISKAVKLNPKDGHIRDSLGWYFYKIGKLQRALKELKLAYELVNDDSTISKHLALVYEALNRYDLAKDFYLKALKLVKGQSEKDEVQQSLKRIDLLEQKRYPASRRP